MDGYAVRQEVVPVCGSNKTVGSCFYSYLDAEQSYYSIAFSLFLVCSKAN